MGESIFMCVHFDRPRLRDSLEDSGLKGWKVEAGDGAAPWQIEYAKKAPVRATDGNASAEKRCPTCGTGTASFARFCPSCGHRFEDRPAGARELFRSGPAPGPSSAAGPAGYSPFPGPETEHQGMLRREHAHPVPAPAPVPPPGQWAPRPATPYQVAPVQGMDRKNPRLAMFLALVPGLLLFMGMGQFYTRRWLKGIIFFVAGGFLGTMSYVALYVLLDPGNADIFFGTVLVTAMFMVPWLGLLAWSAVDAVEAAKRINAGPP